MSCQRSKIARFLMVEKPMFEHNGSSHEILDLAKIDPTFETWIDYRTFDPLRNIRKMSYEVAGFLQDSIIEEKWTNFGNYLRCLLTLLYKFVRWSEHSAHIRRRLIETCVRFDRKEHADYILSRDVVKYCGHARVAALRHLKPSSKLWNDVMSATANVVLTLNDMQGYRGDNRSSWSVELLQKCSKYGVNMRQTNYVITHINDQLARLQKSLRDMARRRSNMKEIEVVRTRQKLKEYRRCLKYIILHCKNTTASLQSLLLHAHKRKDYDMMMFMLIHAPKVDTKKVAKKYAGGRDIDMTVELTKLHQVDKVLSPFIRREIAPGGKLDRLLYAPPTGLMILRGMRECCYD